MRAFAAEHFLPRERDDIELVPRQWHRKSGRGRIADREPGAIVGNPVPIGQLDARGRAVPHENDVARKIDNVQIGQFAVGRDELACIINAQYIEDVGDPLGAETLPGEHVDTACAEQTPQRHLDRTGIRTGYDTDAIAGRHTEHSAGAIDGFFQARGTGLRSMRPADQGSGQDGRLPAGALRTGARGKTGIGGFDRWFLHLSAHANAAVQ